MATAVQPEKILKELANLWVDLAKEDSAKSANGVIRACSMTLLIASASEEDAESAAETAAELLRAHPGRAISLRFQTSGESVLESRVFARCWMPYGQRQQLCSEQIEISASMDRLADVYAAVLGITVPDLPVVLWTTTPSLLFRPEFAEMLMLARTVIIDTAKLPDTRLALTRVNELFQQGWRMKDLNWSRLTVWREAIAHVFEHDSWRELIPLIDAVTISHRGTTLSTDVCYMAAWLGARLPAAKITFINGAENVDEGVQSVSIAAGVRHASVSSSESGRLAIDVDGKQHQVLMPPQTEQALLHEELSIAGRDPIFEQALTGAVKYSGASNV